MVAKNGVFALRSCLLFQLFVIIAACVQFRGVKMGGIIKSICTKCHSSLSLVIDRREMWINIL